MHYEKTFFFFNLIICEKWSVIAKAEWVNLWKRKQATQRAQRNSDNIYEKLL